MRSTDRGHRDVCRSQGGRIIQPITDHHYLQAMPLQIIDAGYLISRRHSCSPLANSKRIGRGPHGGLSIAREDFDHYPPRLYCPNGCSRVRAQTLPNCKHVPQFPMTEGDNRGLRIKTQSLVCQLIRFAKSRPPEPYLLAFERAAHALPWLLDNARKRRPRLGSACNGCCDGMAAG